MSQYKTKETKVDAVQWNGRNTIELMEMVGHLDYSLERRVDTPLFIGKGTEPQTVVKQYEFVVKHEDGSLEVINAHTFEKMFEKIGE